MTQNKMNKKQKKESKKLKKYFEYNIPKLELKLVRKLNKKAQLTKIYCSEDFEEFAAPLKHASEMYFISIHLDCQNNVIGYHEVSHGSLKSSLVHPREVFKAALLSNANSIILAHNNPSGSLSPSEEDIEVTENLVQAGEILGVKIFDHIVVSYKGIESMRARNQEIFVE